MNKERLKDWLIFIVGSLSFVKFRVIGTFALGEILVLLCSLFIPLTLFTKNRNVRNLFLMSFVWLLGVILSNFWNEIPPEDNLKGIFNVLLLVSLIPFVFWALYDKPQWWIYFYFGFALSTLYNFYFQKTFTSDFSYTVWFVYGHYPLAMFLAGYSYYKGKHLLSYAIIMAFGVWSLFNMSRNIFLVQSLAVIILYYLNKYAVGTDILKLNFNYRIFRIFLSLLVGLFIVAQTYEKMASSGVLGIDAKKKYILQKESSIGLASGRGDFLVALYLIQKHPVFGYGSYAKDKEKMAYKFKQSHGMNLYDEEYDKTDMLPGHSYLLGGWLFAGILGFIFFLYVLIKLWKFFQSRAFVYDFKLLGFEMYLLLAYLCDIFFSPFSDRINFVFFLVFLFIIQEKFEQSQLQTS